MAREKMRREPEQLSMLLPFTATAGASPWGTVQGAVDPPAASPAKSGASTPPVPPVPLESSLPDVPPSDRDETGGKPGTGASRKTGAPAEDGAPPRTAPGGEVCEKPARSDAPPRLPFPGGNGPGAPAGVSAAPTAGASRIVRVSFNPAFREANATRARYRVLCGSAGSGKSFNVAQDMILKLSDAGLRGANALVLRKAEITNRQSTFAELCGAVRRIFGADADRYWRIRQEPMELECLVTGARIVFRGMKDDTQREKLKSVSFPEGKLCFIWLEEATEFTPGDLEVLDDRLRGDLRAVNPALYYQITLTFNPVSADHWLKKRFFDAPADGDVFLSRTVFGQNRFVGVEYARRMERRRETDPEGYRVYALGEWGGSDGLVLTDWEVADLPGDASAYDRVWLAQDFGYHHADCILLVGERGGALCVIREIYVHGLDTEEIIALADRAGFPKEKLMYCDSAEPDRIRRWRRAGWRAVPVKKYPGSVLAGIEELRRHHIVLSPTCVGTLAEIREWRWLRDPTSGEMLDEPAPGADDAMAALRYATEHLREEGSRVRTISKALLGV